MEEEVLKALLGQVLYVLRKVKFLKYCIRFWLNLDMNFPRVF